VLALAAAGLAIGFERSAADRAAEARRAGTVADANRLAALSTTARSLDLSLLLAAAGVLTADTPATEDWLLNALVEHRRASSVFQFAEEEVAETALSADGSTMAAAIGGGSPRVLAWSVGSTPVHTVVAPGGRVSPDDWWPEHIAVSPDGQVVVVASSTGGPQVAAYSAEGRPVRIVKGLRALGGYPRDVAFTSAGELLVFVATPNGDGPGYHGIVEGLDLSSGTVRRVEDVGRTSSDDRWFEASFTDDGSALVIWTRDHVRAVFVDLATGERSRFVLPVRQAYSLELIGLPTGAVQTWSDGEITRYDKSGRQAQVLDVHPTAVRDVKVLPGGRLAASVGDGGEVELWDIDDTGHWSLAESLAGHAGRVEEVEVTGDTLLTASTDGQLISWDLSDDAGFGSAYPGLDGRWVANRIGVVIPGKLVVAPTRTIPRPDVEAPVDVAATFIDPRTGTVVDQVVVGEPAPDTASGSSVSISPDARLVAVTSSTATTILDTGTRARIARIEMPVGRGDFVWCSAWTPDGERLLLGVEGAEYGGLVVVDTATWKVQRTVRVEGGSPQVLEWSPDGSVLVAGVNFTGAIQVFDQALRRLRTVELGAGGDVIDLSFSPDGRRLAIGRPGGQVSVVDTSSWEQVHAPARVSSGSVDDVEWLPDSNTVVAASRDAKVSLYDVSRDLVRSAPLPAAPGPGNGRAYLMPGITDEIVVVKEGAPGHRYPVDPERWLASACSIAGRDLTLDEWARYVPDQPYRPACDAGG
jgi:WD40 repeat protein